MDKIVNPIIEEEIIFLTTAKQSNGEKTVMEVKIGPNGGVPLHYHKRFSETFYVIEGELSIQVGKDIMKLNPEDKVTASKNINHRFYNTSGKPVRFTVELSPASEGFENVLRIGCGLAQDGKAGADGLPKSFLHKAILINMGEGSFVGLFTILEKVLKYFGTTKRARKIEK